MACTRERATQIGELSGGRLDAPGAAELLAHTESCLACSEELDLAADLVAAAAEPRTAPRRVGLRLTLGAGAAAAAGLLAFLALRSGAPERRVRDLARLEPPPVAGFVLRGAGEDEHARDEALRLFAAGEFERAAERLEEVVEAAPDDALAHFYLGVARLQGAADERALDALVRAAELGEGHLAERALWYLVQAHLAREEVEPARALLERMVALDGEYEPNARALRDELARVASR